MKVISILLGISLFFYVDTLAQVTPSSIKIGERIIPIEIPEELSKSQNQKYVKDITSYYTKQINQQNTSRLKQNLLESILEDVPLTDACSNGSFENLVSPFDNWTGIQLCHGFPALPIEEGLQSNNFGNECNLAGYINFSDSDGSGEHSQSIVSTSIDQWLNDNNKGPSIEQVFPRSDNKYSLKLGNRQPGYASEGVARKFKVTKENEIYHFKYAVVMDESHSTPPDPPSTKWTVKGDEAFFMAQAYDSRGNLIDEVMEVGFPSNPFLSSYQVSSHPHLTYYRDWRCAKLDLRSIPKGEEVTVVFINADCGAGGHQAYTYLDDVCIPCKDENEGDVSINLETDSCNYQFPFTIGGELNLPANTDRSNTKVAIEIYQNGTVINRIEKVNPANGPYSFTLNEADFPTTNCFDVVAALSFDLPDMDGHQQTVVKYSHEIKNGGVNFGINNDICLDCGKTKGCDPTTNFTIVNKKETIKQKNNFCEIQGSEGQGFTLIQNKSGKQASAIWCNNQTLDLNKAFTANFSLRFTKNTNSVSGADGSTFTLHKASSGISALGGQGGDLGYKNITPSVSVEFDIYKNNYQFKDQSADKQQDHITINYGGDFTSSDAPVVNVGELEDNKWHPVIVDWNPCDTTLCISLDGKQILCYQKDIVNSLFGGDGTNVIWGFTAAKYNQESQHDVCFCSMTIGEGCQSDYCCGEKNLIRNGNFESDNAGFTSQYSYATEVASTSVSPGQYTIVNGTEAGQISPTWADIQDPTTCDNNGKFLLVNGENGIAGKKVIWEQKVTVEDWKGYAFCFKAKNLNQCAFNILPKLEVKYSIPKNGVSKTIDIPSGPCNWMDIKQNFHLWGTGNSLNIQILLDQTEAGDGNDVAIDNISLVQTGICPATATDFSIQNTNQTGHYTVLATANKEAPCESVWWEICEYDPINFTCIESAKLGGIWWDYTEDFNGYVGTSTQSGNDPVKLQYNKHYKITRGTWGDCHSWAASSIILFVEGERSGRLMMGEEAFKAKRRQK